MAAAVAQYAHGSGEGRPFRGHVTGLVAIQPAVEGFLRVAGMAAFHEQAGKMHACRGGGARGAGGELAPRQARAFFEPFANFSQARLASLEDRIEVRIESGMRLVHLQSDDVNSLAAPGRRQLDTGHETDPGGNARLARFTETGDGVVIGQRERADPARTRAFHERGRRQHAIGKMAVRVEVDEGFGAGIHSGSV